MRVTGYQNEVEGRLSRHFKFGCYPNEVEGTEYTVVAISSFRGNILSLGDTVVLNKNDGSWCPFFVNKRGRVRNLCIDWQFLERKGGNWIVGDIESL